MSFVTQRQTIITANGTVNLNVEDFSSLGIYTVGNAAVATDSGIIDEGSFVKLADLTGTAAHDVKGFNTINLVVTGIAAATDKVIVYGTVNKVTNF